MIMIIYNTHCIYVCLFLAHNKTNTDQLTLSQPNYKHITLHYINYIHIFAIYNAHTQTETYFYRAH